MESAQPQQAPFSAEQRMAGLENVLAVDARLTALEEKIQERTAAARPWWRDPKTVTILGALIAAVIPLLSFINNSFASARDAHRLLVEQQDKIRQLYLDRVLKTGVTEGEQRKVFELLSHLSSDPEMQLWAKDELTATNATIAELTKQKADLENQLAHAQTELESDRYKESIGQVNRQLGLYLEAPNSCTVALSSDPPGARVSVFVYGVMGGGFTELASHTTTPAKIKLPTGAYGLVLSKPGFADKSVSYSAIAPDHCGPVFVTLEKSEAKSQAQAKSP